MCVRTGLKNETSEDPSKRGIGLVVYLGSRNNQDTDYSSKRLRRSCNSVVKDQNTLPESRFKSGTSVVRSSFLILKSVDGKLVTKDPTFYSQVWEFKTET